MDVYFFNYFFCLIHKIFMISRIPSLQKKPSFFSNLLKRWCSQKHCTEIWSFLYYQEIWYFSFLNIRSYSLDRKWKRSFSKNYMKIWYFLQIFWKDGLSQKKKSQKHGLSYFVRKNDISFFQKYDLILLMENERLYFWKRYMEILIFKETLPHLPNKEYGKKLLTN